MTETMTTRQAILHVLKQASEPLKTSQIAEAVVPLVPTLRGKTPRATVGAKLYTEAKRPGSPIRRVEGGAFVFDREAEARDVAAGDDSPAVVPGSKVLRDGREAKPDPKGRSAVGRASKTTGGRAKASTRRKA